MTRPHNHETPDAPSEKAGGAVAAVRPRRVALMLSAIHAAHRANRDAIRFCAKAAGWSLDVMEAGNPLLPDVVDAAALHGYDGVIAEDMGAFSGLQWEKVRTPIVMIDPEPPHRGVFPEVRFDPGMVGRLAAATLLAERCRAYAFVSTRVPAEWAEERGESFRQTVAAAGGVFCGTFASDPEAGLGEDRERLARWLASLPRPCGVFAAMDFRAREVAEACRSAGLSVPLDIAIVGVDDDETICESGSPTLSSVRPDFRGCGEAAVKSLALLMDAHGAAMQRRAVAWYGARGVTVRASTRRLRPDCDVRVAAALEKIRREAADGIGADDVARSMGVSRRRAEMLFRPTGRTIAAAICDAKLEQARQLLETTAMPIGRIAGECGFASPVYLAGLFKRRFGKTMREWRSSTNKNVPSPAQHS